MKLLSTMALLLALTAAPVLAAPALQRPASFDGAWKGKLRFDQGAIAGAAAEDEMRIEIKGSAVHVFPKSLDGREFMPGSFHIAPMLTNAVIYGTHSAEAWVESWAFVVTQKNADTLQVGFARAVNNRGLPLSDPKSKLSTRGSGEFKRVKTR